MSVNSYSQPTVPSLWVIKRHWLKGSDTHLIHLSLNPIFSQDECLQTRFLLAAHKLCLCWSEYDVIFESKTRQRTMTKIQYTHLYSHNMTWEKYYKKWRPYCLQWFCLCVCGSLKYILYQWAIKQLCLAFRNSGHI